jgi:galactokinase
MNAAGESSLSLEQAGVAQNEPALADRLARAGMRPSETAAKARLFAQAIETLQGLTDGSRAEPRLFFVPGRIEALGKHTDYCGGRSLLAALERGICIAVQPRSDTIVRVADGASGLETEFEISPQLTPTAGDWSNYPMTVARRLARDFAGPLVGADIALVSDLPQSVGMSSSSALVTGIFKALAKANHLAERADYREHLNSPEALAAYVATIENGSSYGPFLGDRGVGTFGGSEDHTAICCCRRDQLAVYSFCPMRREETLAMPAGFVFAVASSGVTAEKTGGALLKYNRASRMAATILEMWPCANGSRDQSLADVVRSSADAPDLLRQLIDDSRHPEFKPQELRNRFDHFLVENEQVIPAAVAAIQRGEMETFGRLVDESQRAAERLLENQIPQTMRLARLAREHGAVAASAFGAGFGGSVWAMIEESVAEEFLRAWSAAYGHEFPDDAANATFFLSGAGSSLLEL